VNAALHLLDRAFTFGGGVILGAVGILVLLGVMAYIGVAILKDVDTVSDDEEYGW
jgi:hypothetical protein